ncbi:unnamed protein product, partial [Ectocarpus sp. 12 AP-2014]
TTPTRTWGRTSRTLFLPGGPRTTSSHRTPSPALKRRSRSRRPTAPSSSITPSRLAMRMAWWYGSTLPPRTSCRATSGSTTGSSSSRWTTTPALTGSRTPATSPSAE